MTAAADLRPGTVRGASIQLQVLLALVLRELHSRFGRSNIGYLWLFLEPGLLAAGVSIIHVILRVRLPYGMAVVPFYLSGYSAFCCFRSIVNRAGTTIEANSSLLFHARISVFDLLFARSLLDLAATFGAGTILLYLAWALGFGPFISDPVQFIVGYLMIFWLSFGFAACVLAGATRFTLMDRFIHPLTYLIMPVSGAFVSFVQLPGYYRAVVTWVPTAQAIEMIRQSVFRYDTPDTSLTYTIGCAGALTVLGLAGLRATRPLVELSR